MPPATSKATPRVANETMRMNEAEALFVSPLEVGPLGCGVGTGLRSTKFVETAATATSQLQLAFI